MSFTEVLGENDLREILKRLNGRRYGAYKRLRAKLLGYEFGEALLTRIQGDPYAPPSVIEITIPPNVHKLPNKFLDERCIIPLLDYLARLLHLHSRRLRRKCGTGNSGYLGIPKPSPCILRRSCVDISGRSLVFRLFIGLPARGRRILGDKAREILLDKIPELVRAVIFQARVREDLEKHISLYLDQEYIRRWLYESDALAFIGDGSILPRESSYSIKPLKTAIPIKSPPELRA
ncbi:MAG: ATP-binding protein, partial [Thaumarchaeota archaeon]|nr:ATP-binding protein [Nitrososphaerota archaeon]